MYRKLAHEMKRSWVDQLVVSAVGLMSSSPLEGTAVHFISRPTMSKYHDFETCGFARREL